LRLPRFEYLEPETLEKALDLLNARGEACRILGGGTDLLVRMKQRLCQPAYLLSLKHLDELDGISRQNGGFTIGARTSLAAVAASSDVKKYLPALSRAMEAVGAPSIQHHSGTIGGNLCQEARCLFYNQSKAWRSGKPPCHKAGGQTCYARADSDRCHSTFQSDGATALLALDAEVTIAGIRGERRIPLVDLYSTVGEHPLTLEPGEILTYIHVPISDPGASSAYKRLAYRSAIDYPIVSVGVSIQTDDAVVKAARIAVGSMSRAPLLLNQVARLLEGNSITDAEVMSKVASQCRDLASTFAVDNVGANVDYRSQMVSVLVRRALKEAFINIDA
jgi:4-hydroxybenzoyl-CoA reductase beta subunit